MTTTTAPDPFVTEAARVLRAAPGATWPATAATATTPTVRLTVGTRLIVPADAPPALMRALRDKFTLRNPAYEEAERYDRSTADLDEWLIYYETLRDGSLALPRGATQLVYGMCEAHGVRVVWDDRTRLAPVATPFSERVTLSAAQTRAVDTALGRRYGVIEAPPGAGKTIMGLTVVARRGQRTLWLTHTKELAYQLIDRAGMVLGLTSDEVGLVGDGACRIGDRLTVALVQSLARGIPSALLDVGHVVVDECHHAPAEQMAAVMSQFPARFLTGLTATWFGRCNRVLPRPNPGDDLEGGPGRPPHHAGRPEARHEPAPGWRFVHQVGERPSGDARASRPDRR